MEKVKIDTNQLFQTNLSVNATFCVEIDGKKKSVTGLEAHLILFQMFDTFMRSNGKVFELPDGHQAEVKLMDYYIDPEINV